MTLVDTNLLIYATFTDTPEHDRTRAWLEARLGDPDEGVALCWPVLYSFFRLITSPRVFGPHAVPVAHGWSIVAGLLSQPAARLVTPGAQHASTASELVATPGLRSDDVPDVEIATLAVEHGLILATHDHGFRRFARLRVVDPLGEGK